MHALLEKLLRDHKNLKRILNMLESQLNEFYAGRESDFDLKIELLEYIEFYAELSHHPTENMIFHTAMDRVGDKKRLLEKLVENHEKMNGFAKKFRQSLEGIIQGEVLLREEVEIEGRQFIAAQREHLLEEETEVFPILDQALTEDEWEKIGSEVPEYNDPVFEKRDPNRFRTLFRYLKAAED